jgi:hypothetical protein
MEPIDKAWVIRTYPQTKVMAQYVLYLIANKTEGPDTSVQDKPEHASGSSNAVHTTDEEMSVGAGMIYGPAEHDTCKSESHFFSVSAWAWRGLVMFNRFLGDSDAVSDPGMVATVATAITKIDTALAAATALSLVRDSNGSAFFLPPYAAVNFTPYSSMVGGDGYAGGASYSNFRYFSEMLSSGYFPEEVEAAMNIFRESHTGTLSGMTRFRDHL